MTDSFDLDHIESLIKQIESEVVELLKLITDKSLPDRDTMVNRDYFKRIQQYDIIQNSQTVSGVTRTPIEDEPRNTVQFIKSLLVNIPEEVNERKRYLEKVLGYFSSISANDKSVLIHSLINEPSEKIKAAIHEILDAFS